MSDLQINIKQIRNKFIQVIIYEFPLILLFNWLESWSESLPKAINALIILLAFLMFFYGYKLCCQVADNYAQYKGYKNHFYVYSILNIFGLLILFLLKNRNLSKKRIDKERLLNFSISSILISWFIIIPFVLILPGILIVFYIASLEGYAKYVSNYEDLLSIVTIPMDIMCIWYFIRELKRVNINHKFILGSLRKIDFKLPIGLTIITYLFDCGINPITLYGLSFVVPQYVENQINGQDSTTTLG